jgi:transposase InsO family protein
MRAAGLQAKRKTNFRISTTNSNHSDPIAPNRLNQLFQTESINQVWLTDITYVRTREGFSYLCAFADLHSRRIIGWAISKSMTTELVLKAFDQAIALRNPPAGLMIHSDRGSQFASEAFRKRLKNHNLVQSMSRKGNCYDNAPMESFFKSYKTEEISDTIFETHEEASRSAVEYIERLYNRDRLHSSMGDQSPIEFEKTLKMEERNLPSSEPFVGRSREFAIDERVTEKADFDLPLWVSSE